MKSEHLIAAIGDIDPELVLSAKSGVSVRDVHNPSRRKAHNKHGYKVLIAAAIFVLLIASAFAYWTVGEGFLHFFSKQTEQKLTPGVQQYVEDHTVGIGQKKSVNGWAVMIDSAICDANHLYLKIDIEAPESVDLDGESYLFRQHSISTTETENKGVLYVGGTWNVMRDEDIRDNTISLILTQEMIVPTGSDLSYSSGASQTLRLEDLCVWQGNKEVVVAEGVWSFDFVLSGDLQDGIEFIDQPVVCDAYRMTGKKTEVQLLSFRVSPLGAICTYSFSNTNEQEAIHLSDVKVIMNDGREIKLIPSAGLANNDSTNGICSFTVDEPVLLQEVDRIVFQNGVELPPLVKDFLSTADH